MQQIFNKVIFTFVSYESDDLLGPDWDQVIFFSRPPQIAGLAKARPTALSADPPYSTRSPYGFLLPLIVLSYNLWGHF